MFANAPLEECLDPTDAQFVDVLHTDMNCKYNKFKDMLLKSQNKKDEYLLYISHFCKCGRSSKYSMHTENLHTVHSMFY